MKTLITFIYLIYTIIFLAFLVVIYLPVRFFCGEKETNKIMRYLVDKYIPDSTY
jgi:hypothetical protein